MKTRIFTFPHWRVRFPLAGVPSLTAGVSGANIYGQTVMELWSMAIVMNRPARLPGRGPGSNAPAQRGLPDGIIIFKSRPR